MGPPITDPFWIGVIGTAGLACIVIAAIILVMALWHWMTPPISEKKLRQEIHEENMRGLLDNKATWYR
jgi:hypothetical protein